MIKFLLLQLVVLLIKNSSSCLVQSACEGQSITIDCGKDVIGLIDVEYGRREMQTCGQQSNFDVSQPCLSPSAMDVVSYRCERKHACTIYGNNNVFGDPCKNVYKYLIVKHSCLTVENLLACENDHMTLSCTDGQVINIEDAFYGRDNKKDCGKAKRYSHECFSTNSLSKVKEACEGQTTCIIQANNILFGDPCHRMRKYLRVKYTCQTTKKEIVCENNEMTISCKNNELINIQSAFYGRDDKITCGFQNNFHTVCNSDTSLRQVKYMCQGRNMCIFRANNFLFNDPCPGVIKYLKVRYSCEKAPC